MNYTKEYELLAWITVVGLDQIDFSVYTAVMQLKSHKINAKWAF